MTIKIKKERIKKIYNLIFFFFSIKGKEGVIRRRSLCWLWLSYILFLVVILKLEQTSFPFHQTRKINNEKKKKIVRRFFHLLESSIPHIHRYRCSYPIQANRSFQQQQQLIWQPSSMPCDEWIGAFASSTCWRSWNKPQQCFQYQIPLKHDSSMGY